MTECPSCGSALAGQERFCPSCGTALSPAGPQTGTTTAQSGTFGFARVGAILILVLLALGLFLYLQFLRPGMHPVIRDQPVVTESVTIDSSEIGMTEITAVEEGEDLTFPVADVLRYRLIRFHHLGGKTPRYVLAYLTPDGRVVTAISYSDNCRSTDFFLKGREIYCANCPSHWDMVTMEAMACCGKFYPDPIPSRVENGYVRIPRREVEGWAGRL